MSTGSAVRAAPDITATSHRVKSTGANAYRLTVQWRIANPTGKDLYVMLATPIVTTTRDPLILDHTDPYSGVAVNPNQPPIFLIVHLAPGAVRSETFDYGAPMTPGARLDVIGRFGFSDAPPDPHWVEQSNWKELAAWQRPVDSARYSVTAPP